MYIIIHVTFFSRAYIQFLCFIKIIPRKWPLLSTKEAINENPEQYNAQKFRHSNCMKIKACTSISKQIYLGDRFLPSRRNYNFDMAHYLLMKEKPTEKSNIIDVCKEVRMYKAISIYDSNCVFDSVFWFS